MEFREIVDGDVRQVLELNEASVSELSKLDCRRLEWIVSMADRSVVIDHEGRIVAFVIALTANTDYDSPNYCWFGSHFDHFYYLDRIVVAEPFRRSGIATRLYDLMEAEAATRFGRMVCDVGYEPANEASLAFHSARGYLQVTQLRYGNEKVVVLLCREFEHRVPRLTRRGSMP